MVAACGKVHVVWGRALNLEFTRPADGLDVGERERGLVSDPKPFGQSYLVSGAHEGQSVVAGDRASVSLR